jgi:RND family efflux transporter MFP subunit
MAGACSRVLRFVIRWLGSSAMLRACGAVDEGIESFMQRRNITSGVRARGWSAGIVTVTLGALAIMGCKSETPKFAPPPPPAVTVALPTKQVVPELLEFTGTTRPVETVEIRARVRGFIQTKHVAGGQRIKAGDLIYTIDPRPFEAVVSQVQAELQAARADVKLAETTLARVQESVTRGGAAEIELDRATAERDRRAAAILLAQARLDAAKLDVEFTQVKSPIDGRLSVLTIDPGQLVGANEATLLGTVINDSVIYATYYIPERQLLDIRASTQNRRPGEDGRPNVRVMMALANENEYKHQGEYAWGENALDASTGLIKIEARFDNKDGTIIAGGFVRLRSILGERERMLVPQVAVQRDQNGSYLLVVGPDNKVVRRPVFTGQSIGSARVLEPNPENLEAQEYGVGLTDRVIVNGVQRARPGAEVAATEQPVGGT